MTSRRNHNATDSNNGNRQRADGTLKQNDDVDDVVTRQNNKPILDRFRLDGKVALVTGAGQGIGRGYAFALAQAGARVAVVDIRADLATRVVQELQANGYPNCLAVVADVTQADEVQSMIDQILEHWDGTLTIAVNNAGIADWTAAEEVTLENWHKINDVNLKGVFLCSQAEGRVMMKQGYGKIINTASMSASIVNYPQQQVVYNVTKAGVKHMTKTLAVEWATKGIRVNCISPAYTKTSLLIELLKTPQGQQYGQQWLGMTPIGRFAEVADLMGAIVYLASEASDYMTGHDMVIDGGYSAL